MNCEPLFVLIKFSKFIIKSFIVHPGLDILGVIWDWVLGGRDTEVDDLDGVF